MVTKLPIQPTVLSRSLTINRIVIQAWTCLCVTGNSSSR